MAKKKTKNKVNKKVSKAGKTVSDSIPKFGMLTNPSIDVLKEIRRGARLGVDYIEVGMEPPLGTNEILLKNRKRILELVKKKGMPIQVAHTAYWGEYGSTYGLVRQGWVSEARKQIDVATKFGSRVFVIHSHSVGKTMTFRDSRKEVLNNFVKSLRELVAHCKKNKITVVLENDPGGIGSVGQFKDIKYIVDRVPGLGFHLDVGHAFITGGNKCIREFIRRLGGRLEHVHVHDNHGLSDEHLPLGKGLIDYKMVVRELKRAGYGSREGDTITLEVFQGGEKGFRSSLRKIKKLWEAE